MDLGREVVEHGHAVAFGDEFEGDVGADKAGAAGDQDMLHGVKYF